ncbi:MAG: YccF domain-containing protein [Aliidiomarina sp.]|uniref:YccF domain-containing protein n=1 Tax=Aliidiomarina sp. TaxID=1872439 RepID=UPI0025B9AD15|nr:YccF domain-containing protein [Aliidiomarina sp.]MCH8501972.1 YccF domain-containing protein [Aliidiomarina sp.]
MRTIGNLLWFIFGGFFMGLAWWLYALLAFVSIVGIPWGRACFVLGKFAFLPFGREAINRRELTQRGDIGTSVFGTLGNIIWFILAGLWLAIGHIITACFLAITIIGIPFAIQHIKLAGIALAPIGKTVVDIEIANAARRANADARVASMRR